MPYIKQELRNALDEDIEKLISNIKTNDLDDREGIVNYVISRIVAASLKPDTGWRYKYLNRAYGTFLCAAAEFYRMMISGYENYAILDNGNIKEYKL